MAVTLTSTGITFEDGTSLDSTPSLSMSKQVFNNSSTWNRTTAGSPNNALVFGRAGGVQGIIAQQGYYATNVSVPGPGGATFVAEPISTNGNIAVTIGTGGSGFFFCGHYGYNCYIGKSGNKTNVGGVQANSGVGYKATYASRWSYDGFYGSHGESSAIAWAIGKTTNRTNSPNTSMAGIKGKAYIVW